MIAEIRAVAADNCSRMTALEGRMAKSLCFKAKALSILEALSPKQVDEPTGHHYIGDEGIAEAVEVNEVALINPLGAISWADAVEEEEEAEAAQEAALDDGGAGRAAGVESDDDELELLQVSAGKAGEGDDATNEEKEEKQTKVDDAPELCVAKARFDVEKQVEADDLEFYLSFLLDHGYGEDEGDTGGSGARVEVTEVVHETIDRMDKLEVRKFRVRVTFPDGEITGGLFFGDGGGTGLDFAPASIEKVLKGLAVPGPGGGKQAEVALDDDGAGGAAGDDAHPPQAVEGDDDELELQGSAFGKHALAKKPQQKQRRPKKEKEKKNVRFELPVPGEHMEHAKIYEPNQHKKNRKKAELESQGADQRGREAEEAKEASNDAEQVEQGMADPRFGRLRLASSTGGLAACSDGWLAGDQDIVFDPGGSEVDQDMKDRILAAAEKQQRRGL